MSIRVHGTCQSLACDGLQPPHGSPLSQVFFKNRQRKQAPNFLISHAAFLASGRSGPFLFPTFFTVSSLGAWDGFCIIFFAAFALGLLRVWRRPGCELLVDTGESWGEGSRANSTGLWRVVGMIDGGIARSIKFSCCWLKVCWWRACSGIQSKSDPGELIASGNMVQGWSKSELFEESDRVRSFVSVLPGLEMRPYWGSWLERLGDCCCT